MYLSSTLAPVDVPLSDTFVDIQFTQDSLTVLILAVGVLVGIFLGQAFSFWKW